MLVLDLVLIELWLLQTPASQELLWTISLICHAIGLFILKEDLVNSLYNRQWLTIEYGTPLQMEFKI